MAGAAAATAPVARRTQEEPPPNPELSSTTEAESAGHWRERKPTQKRARMRPYNEKHETVDSYNISKTLFKDFGKKGLSRKTWTKVKRAEGLDANLGASGTEGGPRLETPMWGTARYERILEDRIFHEVAPVRETGKVKPVQRKEARRMACHVAGKPCVEQWKPSLRYADPERVGTVTLKPRRDPSPDRDRRKRRK